MTNSGIVLIFEKMWNKDTKKYLQEAKYRNLKWKIQKSKEIIGKALKKFDIIYVAISGGKDSQVLLDLILRYFQRFRFRWWFLDTGAEYPETYEHILYLENLYKITIVKTLTIWNPVKLYSKELFNFDFFKFEKGKRKSSYKKCCYFVKETTIKSYIRQNQIQCEMTGEKAFDSFIRWNISGQYGCQRYVHRWYCFKYTPLVFWKDRDIWNYRKYRKLKFNLVYKHKLYIPKTKKYFYRKQSGCWICPSGLGKAKGNWEFLKKYYPRYFKVIKKDYYKYLLK